LEQPTQRILAAFSDEDQFLHELDAYLHQFTMQRQISGQVHRLKIPGHDSIAFWPPKKRRRFSRVAPSSDLYEAVTTAAMSFLLDRFRIDNVWDIGAYSGYFSMVAASKTGSTSTVHAFEMDPRRSKNIGLTLAGEPYAQGRVHNHLAGMSDHEESERTVWHTRNDFYETKPTEKEFQESVWRRLKFRMRGMHDRNILHEAKVLVTSIDAFAERHGAPDLIKLDVDGYEAKVIPGALRTFREKRPFLLFELHKSERLARLGATRQGLMKMLFDCGYRAATFSDHHDCTKAKVERVTPDSPAVHREKTDLFLLY
jgi:FkbM family methyltransferase